jgi:hypothetical protein
MIKAIALFAMTVLSTSLNAAMITFNSPNASDASSTRDAWLSATGVIAPQYLVDFETGFTDNQNVSGLTGLFPGGLVIRDTSVAGLAMIEGTAGGIGGSNPVGSYALEQNEAPYLELDFSSNPVDYIGFRDIDHTGTSITVTFVGGSTSLFTIETTTTSGNSAEFTGIFRNDMPKITLVQMDSSGDGSWAIDNLEYGASAVPVPAAIWLFSSGLIGLIGLARREV